MFLSFFSCLVIFSYWLFTWSGPWSIHPHSHMNDHTMFRWIKSVITWIHFQKSLSKISPVISQEINPKDVAKILWTKPPWPVKVLNKSPSSFWFESALSDLRHFSKSQTDKSGKDSFFFQFCVGHDFKLKLFLQESSRIDYLR